MTNPEFVSNGAWRHLTNPGGLDLEVDAQGTHGRMRHGEVLLNLFPGNWVEGGPVNLYLRRHGDDGTLASVPLLGPRGPSRARLRADARQLILHGRWQELRYVLTLTLAERAPAWFWHLTLENAGDRPLTLDLMYAQDLGLAHYWAVRLNEYYVSQYLDHAPLSHPEHGWVLATRQNLPMGGQHPWCLLGSLGQAVAYSTDALQFYGLERRAGRVPPGLSAGLPGARLQHEHALASLQEAPLSLAPGERATRGFFGWYLADHPAVSGPGDLEIVAQVLALPEARNLPPPFPDADAVSEPSAVSLFARAPLLDTLDLTAAELTELFGPERRHPETAEDGTPLAFSVGERTHVVLKAKELRVRRPHGQILRTGSALTPDEAGLTTTVWMAGVFHSLVTQGHVSINRLLSTTHSYLGLFRSHGLRLFVALDDGWRLLDVPSAFVMTPQSACWYYRYSGGLLRVESRAPTERHELTLDLAILAGPPRALLFSGHVAINGDDGIESVPVRFEADADGWFVRPIPDSDLGRRFPAGGFRLTPRPGARIARVGGDELLFSDGRSRQQPFFCLLTEPTTDFGLRIAGHLVPDPSEPGLDEAAYWTRLTAGLRLEPPAGALAAPLERLGETLPWFVHDALIHYLSPRGLEQYSGGGWGTRDVAQGPVELLLALGLHEPVRALLLLLFRNQNPDGDWPQWFMFFDRERNIRPGDSHGDIVFWPLLALGQYLAAAGDRGLLDASVPFFHPEGAAAADWAPIRAHLDRALAVIAARRIPGTALAAYGNGDWNDALQPLDPAMRAQLCSAWTVTLHHRTLDTLAAAFRHLGLSAEAEALAAQLPAVRADFQRLLIQDGVLTGLADFATLDAQGRPRPLLHPRDTATGISHSLLPAIHAIIEGLLTPEQAHAHLAMIERHLLGPDGARLFDRPMPYRGGAQRRFQRIESSSFFGREIGLMYTHAHLRYAEALWRQGDAEGLFRALRQAAPLGLRALVPTAALRQSNCYFSSSDADFADRYQADADYARLLAGEIPLEGGWRIYSSGAGIAVALILRGLLGIRIERERLILDPVLPPALDGLRVARRLLDHDLEMVYRVGAAGHGPVAVWLNGVELPFARGASPYRTGAAEIALAEVRAGLRDGGNLMRIEVG